MMTFTMYHSGKAGVQGNTYYKNAIEIRNADDLAAACLYDNVCVQFANNHRSNADFQRCFAIAADCDNSGTDNPLMWITPATVAERLPGVQFYDCASRNNNKTKHAGEPGEEGPRPRYHYYFPLSEPITDIKQARAVMSMLLRLFPEFDDNGTKPAQFFYGHSAPETAAHDGTIDIVQYLASRPDLQPKPEPKQAPKKTTPTQRLAAAEDDFFQLNIDDALAYISPDDYDTWIKVGQGLYTASKRHNMDFFDLWDRWSSGSGKYKGEQETRKKWATFRDSGADRTADERTIFNMAKSCGWTAQHLTGEYKANHDAAEAYRHGRAASWDDEISTDYPLGAPASVDPETGEIIETGAGADPQQQTTETINGVVVHTVPGAAAPAEQPQPEEEWQALDKGEGLPAFPLDRLPAWIQEHIREYAATNGASKDYCAAAVLGTVSAVIVGHCDIPFNGTHREPAQLYTLFVGSSGTMKSSVIGHFTKPAADYLRKNNDLTIKTNYAITKQIDDLKKQLDTEKRKKSGSQERIREITEQLEQKRKEIHNAFPVPWDDVTPESLVGAMRFSRGTANIATAEGNIINVLVGRSYTQRGAVPNVDVFLKGADAESIHNFRVTSGETDIPRADLSMLLGIQPDLLERLCTSQDAVGRGLAQRFLIYTPEENITDIDHTQTVVMDPAHMDTWTEHIGYIAARFMDPDKPAKLMELEPAADMVIRRFWNYEKELKKERGTADEESITGWISKLHGKALRVAAILALLRDRDALTITAEDAENAVALFKDYYIPQFIGAYEHADTLSKPQRQIVNWIMRRAESTGKRASFTERDLQQDLRQRVAFSGKDGPERFRVALDGLREKNYIRPAPAEKTTSGRGRPSKAWQINPELFEDR